jgi:hypothetical protein
MLFSRTTRATAAPGSKSARRQIVSTPMDDVGSGAWRATRLSETPCPFSAVCGHCRSFVPVAGDDCIIYARRGNGKDQMFTYNMCLNQEKTGAPVVCAAAWTTDARTSVSTPGIDTRSIDESANVMAPQGRVGRGRADCNRDKPVTLEQPDEPACRRGQTDQWCFPPCNR